MKRVFDITLALCGGIVLFIPSILIAILIKITSKGPILHWSDRVGISNDIFKMPKFRSMKIETPQVATHLLKNQTYITGLGKTLRKTSLDEIPQLYSILTGDMSFVGPRPALFNQNDLIELRTEKGIHKLRPGLTGLAQINGRDDLSVPKKVSFDKDYLEKHNLLLDIKIIIITFMKVFFSKNITH